MTNLSDSIDALVCDMDGVLYRGEEPIPGAAEAIERLGRRGIALVYCTNNSERTIDQFVEKLGRMGIEALPEQIVTSASVAEAALKQRFPNGGTAYVIGKSGTNAAAAAAGLEALQGEDGRSADVVIVGWDRDFNWDKMRIASQAVRAGAMFVATNSDATFPSPDGLWPGSGAILASIETAAGTRAEVFGKPHLPMMEMAAARIGVRRGIAMIGDRNDTDLAGARTLGWTTILVLSGVTHADEVEALDPQPDLVLGSIAELQ